MTTTIWVETCPICGKNFQMMQSHQHADGRWLATKDFQGIRIELMLEEILKRLKELEPKKWFGGPR